MSPKERIVAIGLLTRDGLNALGPSFKRAWPIDDAPSFPELLGAIDEADVKSGRSGSGELPR